MEIDGFVMEGIKAAGLSEQGIRHLPKRLFVFGDSAVDTGNTGNTSAQAWRPPYGSTFPGKPSGRFSDGRLLTDFIAAYLGIPSPTPYKARHAGGGRQRYGMNFAYAGTGVFDTFVMLPNLTTQIGFFEQLINGGTYRSSDLRSSMALISASTNDYSFYVLRKGTVEGLNEFTGLVVNQTAVDLRRLSRLGVGKIAILGLFPFGCFPVIRQLLASAPSSCDDLFNRYSSQHNSLLRKAVDEINAELGRPSHVVVLDTYSAADSIIHHHDELGPRFNDPLKPCCMGLSAGIECGSVDAQGKPLYGVCGSPDSTFFWDNVHPTQAGWAALVRYFLPTLDRFFS
ncbi:GDSL esterase/lipase 5 [Nymphaea thermarum]|nr:GDSL esterase/lipase 5 [Nymphaea thermarum]